jgi:hypothetical protein
VSRRKGAEAREGGGKEEGGKREAGRRLSTPRGF